MELININKLKYNIGIDAGDNIVNVIFNKDETSLISNKYFNMTFSIPEIDEEYNIKIVIGNNILTEDNIVLDNINIKSEDNNRKIFINIKIDYYLYIDITTKINTIYKNIININILCNWYHKLDDDNFELHNKLNIKYDIPKAVYIFLENIINELMENSENEQYEDCELSI